ncbi:hypothetical protein MPER_04720 [Moniliophthora perniciosa FA553]|nr:hypothetical protein MPER_04720 [Moniliophthora perniciosa FA553]
ILPFPEYLSYEEAPTWHVLGTAYNALTGSKPLKEGQSVASGHPIFITSLFTQKLGAKYGIDYVKNEAWEAQPLELTNGVGVDHVVELDGLKRQALEYDGR